ncbi:MAG: hypothetical protein M3077_09300 [Candidatus Dormibacteraeota bacterium]|nr:hypothetical protein [Candidatus Dormibacteraeota bacterium]
MGVIGRGVCLLVALVLTSCSPSTAGALSASASPPATPPATPTATPTANPAATPAASPATTPAAEPSASRSASAAASYPSAQEASAAGAQTLAERRFEIFVAGDQCPPNQPCIHGPGHEYDGDHAAYTVYRATGATHAGPGPYDCFVYVFEDAAGWHPFDGYCTAQLSASVGGTNYIFTPGTCANVRERAGLQARVRDCLPMKTFVSIDDGPAWLDGYLWWHIAGQGWTVYQNLYPDFNSASMTCLPAPCWIGNEAR